MRDAVMLAANTILYVFLKPKLFYEKHGPMHKSNK